MHIQRSDGSSIGQDNFWTTDRTFPQLGNPTYEDKVHILDFAEFDGTETYTVIYGEPAENNLPVAQDDAFEVAENGTLNGALFQDNGMGEDSDVETELLVVSQVNDIATFEGRFLNLESGARLQVFANGTFEDALVSNNV